MQFDKHIQQTFQLCFKADVVNHPVENKSIFPCFPLSLCAFLGGRFKKHRETCELFSNLKKLKNTHPTSLTLNEANKAPGQASLFQPWKNLDLSFTQDLF